MTKFFLSVYDYFSSRRSLLFTLLFILVIMFLYAAGRVRFKEDISRFLPGNRENERINNAYRYVASPNTVTVYCSHKDSGEQAATGRPPQKADESSEEAMATLADAVDALAGCLQAHMDSTRIKSLFYRVNMEEMMAVSSFIIDNMPYFLDEDDYERMDTLLTREAIARRMTANKNALASPTGMFVRHQILSDPLQMTDSLMRKLQDFRVGEQYRLYRDHLFSEDGEALIFIECAIPASETAMNALFLDSLQSFIAETEKAFAGVIFEYAGAVEIGLTNARRIRQDTILSVLLAVAFMLALLIYAFRSGRKILLIFASVLFGGLFAMAFLYVIRGEVSVIAVGISSIMFGIAINYPLHFLEHSKHVSGPRIVIKEIIAPLTIGNITTVGAFMSLTFTGSEAMSDLGWFASLLLVGTILFVLFILPHLTVPGGDPGRRKNALRKDDPAARKKSLLADALQRQKMTSRADEPSAGKENERREAKSPSSWWRRCNPASWRRFIAGAFETDRRIVTAVILLTVFFGFFSGDSRFETDMQKINYMTEAQKKSFDRMMKLLNGNRHVVYYVTEGVDMEAALAANEEIMPVLQSLVDGGEVYRTGGIGEFLPSRLRRAERIGMWERFWSTRRDSVTAYLREESQALGFRRGTFRLFEEMVGRKWEVVDVSHFAPVRETFAKNYIIEKENKTMVVNMLYTDRAKAQALEAKLNGSGVPASIAFDAGSITRRMVASLSESFNYVLYVCGFIVFTFLILSMGRVELALIAFVPLVLSWVWILGLMNIFDIRFNIVNVILATFIFGQGDDYTLFMTEGLMYEYACKRKILASYKKSIAMSALIMFAGMGTLLLAKHPALRSLAEVTVVGMFSVVMMAYIFPSLLFRLLTVKKGCKRLMPVTLKNLFCTVYAFLFFLVMSLVITVVGWVMFTCGKTTERKKMRYHRLLNRTARFVIRHIPQVGTTFRNLSGETFDKPGIIICNHQSHLDLMCVMMLTPRLIILTNDWVWNSPFYGRMIKYADFYPVSSGLENALDRLQNALRRGYSIVIFPEGTRSPDCSIGRFHRGAFYLARRLNVDLIPVLIHGVGHVLPKEEFMLRKGRIHIRIMPRITPDDDRFRRDYSPRSADVRRYYREEYRKLCRDIETPAYYADLVMKNYIYKGPSVEREVRRNLRKHTNYAKEIAALPDTGEIVIPNTGYGEYALLSALVKKDLQITAVEPDPDRHALAANCASVPRNLRYVERSDCRGI